MKVSDILEQLRNARSAHKAWVARAEGLVLGMPLEKEQVPILPTDCNFGKWYYGSGQLLRKLPAYYRIEKVHDELHRTYMQIFKLLYDEPDVSAIGKFFGRVKKAKAAQLKKAEGLLVKLRGISDEVCALLETLEIQVVEKVKKKKEDKEFTKTIDERSNP
ncbi:MAG: CZB domain-containing protein [Ghiorsea sp.]